MTKREGMAVRIEEAVGAAASFLERRQLASGEFTGYHFILHLPMSKRTADSSPFVTSLVAYSLGYLPGPAARAMLSKAVEFLRGEMEAPGVWRYWTSGHPNHASIPPDLDDTCSISYVLGENEVAPPPNLDLILANRDRDGRFFTWVVPRLSAGLDRSYWSFCLRDLPSAPRYHKFWQLTEAERNDVDAGVNANALLYLGEGEATTGAVAYLKGIVEEGREDGCDKWYLDRMAFYYLYTRAAARSAPSLASLAAKIRSRILDAQASDGSLGNHLESALGACALLSLRADGPELERAVSFLLETQAEDGCWPCHPMYYGGPKRYNAWGSEELTTALALEALVRYGASLLSPRAAASQSARRTNEP